MTTIYHLVPRQQWEQSPPGPYRDPSLDSEGFIHCSYEHQVEAIANTFFAQESELLVLHLDPNRLGDLVREEAAAPPKQGDNLPEIQGPFPHVYGPIEREAVVKVQALTRDSKGQWQLPRSDT